VIRWAVRLTSADVQHAVRLWRVPGVEVCAVERTVWLRGPEQNEALELRLRSLPGAERFSVLPDGQLCSPGALVPRGWLPPGPWVALNAWLVVEPPVASLAGRLAVSVPLHLVRAVEVAEPDAVLTDMVRWASYARTAPQVRLDRWLFTAADDGRVLVCGRPVPPIPGRCLVERQGVLTPAGWTWSPQVEPAIIRSVGGLQPGDLMLWHVDGRWERMPGEEFVRASRSAVRKTAEAFVG
jgi:hypothetical protein